MTLSKVIFWQLKTNWMGFFTIAVYIFIDVLKKLYIHTLHSLQTSFLLT